MTADQHNVFLQLVRSIMRVTPSQMQPQLRQQPRQKDQSLPLISGKILSSAQRGKILSSAQRGKILSSAQPSLLIVANTRQKSTP
eukprot:2869968-Amphidinium_carterae.1